MLSTLGIIAMDVMEWCKNALPHHDVNVISKYGCVTVDIRCSRHHMSILMTPNNIDIFVDNGPDVLLEYDDPQCFEKLHHIVIAQMIGRK